MPKDLSGTEKRFQNTPVGQIPTDWELSSVGAEFYVRLGKMLDVEKNVGVPKPYIGNRAVQWNHIDVSDLPTVPMTKSDIKRYRLMAGDLLVCEGGEVGRAAIWKSQLEECYYQKALHRLRPIRDYDPRLMLEFLHLWSANDVFANYVTQTSIAHLTREKLEEIPLPRPLPHEQRAIAEVLGDMDDLLLALDDLIEKKRKMKQGAIQQLLTGKKRLPGFEGDWEIKCLAAVCSMKSGEGVTSFNIDGFSKYPCYGGNGVRGFTARFTHDGHYALIGRQGALCGNVLGVQGRFFASEHAIVVTPSAETDIRWLTYVLRRMNLNQYSESSAQPGLSVSKILNLEVTIPPTKAEQAAIACILTDMDKELVALEQKKEKTRLLRLGIIQELLTGKTRLL